MRPLAWIPVLVVVGLVGAAPLSAQSHLRRIYVNVLGDTGVPLTDLIAADLMVQEDGTPQKVTRVALANHPMRIALLVDTTEGAQYYLNDLRMALTAFVEAVPAPHELLLVTTGQQVRVWGQPTADRQKVKDSIGRLFAVGGGTFLFDAVSEVDDRFMKKAADRTPLFVVVTGDGTEGSHGYDDKTFSQVVQSLAARDVPVHTIVLTRGTMNAPAAIALNLARGTRGHADTIGASSALSEKLAALTAKILDTDRRMATWYEVEYASTSKAAQPKIEVATVTRTGLRIQLSATRYLP